MREGARGGERDGVVLGANRLRLGGGFACLGRGRDRVLLVRVGVGGGVRGIAVAVAVRAGRDGGGPRAEKVEDGVHDAVLGELLHGRGVRHVHAAELVEGRERGRERVRGALLALGGDGDGRADAPRDGREVHLPVRNLGLVLERGLRGRSLVLGVRGDEPPTRRLALGHRATSLCARGGAENPA